MFTKLGENKILRSRPRAATFVASFAHLKSRALSRDPSGDRVMPKVYVRAQASYGNITVLSHLKLSRSRHSNTCRLFDGKRTGLKSFNKLLLSTNIYKVRQAGKNRFTTYKSYSMYKR